MEIKEYCTECLNGLARQVVALSNGDGELVYAAFGLIEEGCRERLTPPRIANRLLEMVRERTAVTDPYAGRKATEFALAWKAVERLAATTPATLQGVLALSALGNSLDFFTEEDYPASGIELEADIEKIAGLIEKSGNRVLMLGDNVGEFLFDLPLVRYLEDVGKTVYYAVKERPAQNDLSMPDVLRFRLREFFPRIISTGTGEVGIRRKQMGNEVRSLWESDAMVIAKGMGNFETISEYDHERPVLYIMKVKCKAVSEAVNRPVGQYIAITGGDYGA